MSASCDGCDIRASIGLDLHVGGMLSPRLALLFDASGAASYTTAFVQTRYVTNLLYAGAAQYWLLPRFWIKGGLGVARVVQSDAPLFKTFQTETGSVPAGGGRRGLPTSNGAAGTSSSHGRWHGHGATARH